MTIQPLITDKVKQQKKPFFKTDDKKFFVNHLSTKQEEN